MKKNLSSIAEKAVKKATPNNTPQIAKEIWFTLLRQKDLSSLDKLIDIMEEKSSSIQGRIRARITCTRDLSNVELNMIKEKLEKMYLVPVDTNINIDKNILGGLKIQIADEIIDLSWRGKLSSLKIKLGV